MVLYVAKVDAHTVVIIGRGKSDLFMKYIIQQIKHFSAGLTDKMLEVEYFNHIPNQRTPSQERMRGGSMLTTAQAMNKGWCLLLEVGGLGLGVEFLFYQFHFQRQISGFLVILITIHFDPVLEDWSSVHKIR